MNLSKKQTTEVVEVLDSIILPPSKRKRVNIMLSSKEEIDGFLDDSAQRVKEEALLPRVFTLNEEEEAYDKMVTSLLSKNSISKPTQPKRTSYLSIKKFDEVEFLTLGEKLIGVIVKYPSNTEIEIKTKLSNYIVKKEDIINVLSSNNIISNEPKVIAPSPKKIPFNLRKGDMVILENGIVGVITKYPDNNHIEVTGNPQEGEATFKDFVPKSFIVTNLTLNLNQF